MLDLVSKAVVIRDLIAYQHECFSTIGHEEAFNAIDHIIKGIMDMQTVGAVPVKHGYWIYKWNPYFKQELPYCSVCEKASPSARKTDYCSHCGSKMDVLDTNVGNKEKVTE